MKIYISIPYTGMETHSFQIANQVAGELIKMGHVIFSPISHSHPIAIECGMAGDHEAWKAQNEAFLRWCDEMVIVDIVGWEKSNGVSWEMQEISKMGKPFTFWSEF
jgi:hypothetical protein